MDNSISSRSLMIGNVSTEESRNEIRKSPGAPSPPANATIFCFHPFRLVAKRNSSNPCAATCLEMAWVQMSDTRGKLLRESRAIEMIHEDLHKRRAVEIRQLGNFSDDPHVAEPFDGFAVLPVLIANQHYAMHRQFRSMQRGQRQQRVIHRAQSAARRNNHGQFEFHHKVEDKLLLVNRYQHASGALDDQPVVDQAVGHADSPELAARWAGVEIDLGRISMPNSLINDWLIVEGAGAVLVPIND